MIGPCFSVLYHSRWSSMRPVFAAFDSSHIFIYILFYRIAAHLYALCTLPWRTPVKHLAIFFDFQGLTVLQNAQVVLFEQCFSVLVFRCILAIFPSHCTSLPLARPIISLPSSLFRCAPLLSVMNSSGVPPRGLPVRPRGLNASLPCAFPLHLPPPRV